MAVKKKDVLSWWLHLCFCIRIHRLSAHREPVTSFGDPRSRLPQASRALMVRLVYHVK